jgi:hypothetical protein
MIGHWKRASTNTSLSFAAPKVGGWFADNVKPVAWDCDGGVVKAIRRNGHVSNLIP